MIEERKWNRVSSGSSLVSCEDLGSDFELREDRSGYFVLFSLGFCSLEFIILHLFSSVQLVSGIQSKQKLIKLRFQFFLLFTW